jgi:hypothetical protein
VIHKLIPRSILAGVLFTAIPFAPVSGIASPTATMSADPQHLANLKTHGTAEIDRRETNLTGAMTKLNSNPSLNATVKTELSSQLSAEVASLSALKIKLTDETDLATARIDVQSIVADYRVYALMLPKTHMIDITESMNAVEDKLAIIDNQLQSKVNAQKTAGHDITQMQSKLDDLKLQTADATKLTSGLTAQLLAIAPTDYDANHAVLSSDNTSLTNAKTQIKVARDDATTVIAALGTSK